MLGLTQAQTQTHISPHSPTSRNHIPSTRARTTLELHAPRRSATCGLPYEWLKIIVDGGYHATNFLQSERSM